MDDLLSTHETVDECAKAFFDADKRNSYDWAHIADTSTMAITHGLVRDIRTTWDAPINQEFFPVADIPAEVAKGRFNAS